jgi:hypothetical protein
MLLIFLVLPLPSYYFPKIGFFALANNSKLGLFGSMFEIKNIRKYSASLEKEQNA